MKIGVTGTRHGMNDFQTKSVTTFLTEKFSDGAEFHHGDCVGVDAEAALIAKEIGYVIVCHPPTKNTLRAYIDADIMNNEYSYLKRNRHIVDSTEFLMVVPFENEHQTKGGTWYTHDYASKKNYPLQIFFPLQP